MEQYLADTKQCPYCAETIKREAILCRFCNRELNQGVQNSARISTEDLANKEDSASKKTIANNISRLRVVGYCFLGIGLIGVLCIMNASHKEVQSEPATKTAITSNPVNSTQAKQQETSSERTFPLIGEQGTLGFDCTVTRTSEAYDKLCKARINNDKYGISELINAGDVTVLPKGTLLLGLDGSTGFLGYVRNYRVMDGEHKGEVWWTDSSQYVK